MERVRTKFKRYTAYYKWYNQSQVIALSYERAIIEGRMEGKT